MNEAVSREKYHCIRLREVRVLEVLVPRSSDDYDIILEKDVHKRVIRGPTILVGIRFDWQSVQRFLGLHCGAEFVASEQTTSNPGTGAHDGGKYLPRHSQND